MTEINYEEKLAKLKQKQNQLKAQEKALKSRISQQERKKRTKRLIEIGASVESILGRSIEKDDLHKLITFLKKQEERGNYFSKSMK